MPKPPRNSDMREGLMLAGIFLIGVVIMGLFCVAPTWFSFLVLWLTKGGFQ